MTPEEKIQQLEEENTRLKDRLVDLKQLEEELLVDKVFKKAKEKLVNWYTMGGIALFVAGLFGVKSIIDYSKDLVAKKLETFSQDKINAIIINESHKQVEVLLIKQQDTLSKQFQILYENAKSKLDISKYGYGNFDKIDTTAFSTVNLPFIDLSPFVGPVGDQGGEASALGFTLADALGYYIFRKNNIRITFSPRYIYNNINHNSDGGAFFSDGLNFLTKTGGIEEKMWPYKAGDFAKSPPSSAVNATHYKILGWKTIKTDLSTLKHYLSSKNCIIAGMAVYQSLNLSTGIYPTPKLNDQITGGISVLLVGYNDNSELVKFKMAWGNGWGDKGYGYIKYNDLNKLITDAYVIE